jgi:hypothetical protein
LITPNTLIFRASITDLDTPAKAASTPSVSLSSRVDGAARVLDRDRGRSVSVGQCRIVEAELRGTNSDLKTGGGLRRNRGGVQRGGVRPPADKAEIDVGFSCLKGILGDLVRTT